MSSIPSSKIGKATEGNKRERDSEVGRERGYGMKTYNYAHFSVYLECHFLVDYERLTDVANDAVQCRDGRNVIHWRLAIIRHRTVAVAANRLGTKSNLTTSKFKTLKKKRLFDNRHR